MYGFSTTDIVARAPGFTLWRQSHLLGLRVTGTIDDALSDAWRTAAAEQFERTGHPRFFVLDFADSDPQHSLAARVRSGNFARSAARRVEWAAILTGKNPGPLVVVRAVMRVVGMSNIAVYTDAAAFESCVGDMRRGRRPERAPEPKAY